MLCPQCQIELQIDKHPNGALWQCCRCSGVAANLAVLRKQFQPESVLDVWKHAYSSKRASRRCPSCRQFLYNFSCPLGDNTLHLDICKKCQIVWFDKGELDALPRIVDQTDDLPPEIKEQLALFKLQYGFELRDQMDEETSRLYHWLDTASLIIRALLRI